MPHTMFAFGNKFHGSQGNLQAGSGYLAEPKLREAHVKNCSGKGNVKVLRFILACVSLRADKRQAQKMIRTVLFLPALQLKYEQIIKLFPDVNPSFLIVKSICIFLGVSLSH